MKRLFIAIDLPEDLRERFGALCTGVPGARWVQPENFHLTLRFIGEADGGEQQDIVAALSQLRHAPFPLCLASVGHFGSARRPRSIWVGVEKSPALNALRDKIESAVVRAGFESEGRKFTPHIALARLKESPGARLADWFAAHDAFKALPFTVERFVLYSSYLARNGAIHTAEEVFPLKA